MKEEEVFRKALVKWGAEAQMRMCMEEAGEFVAAIAKFGRKINGTTFEQVAEETADLEIMLAQLSYVMENIDVQGERNIDFKEKVAMYRKAKIKRLEGMLSE